MPEVDNNNLTLHDGTVISSLTGNVIEDDDNDNNVDTYVEVPNYADTQRQIVSARTRIADLPLPPEKMTSIGIILFYSMMGIDDAEISSITGLDTEQVGRIRITDAYTKVQKSFIEGIIANDMDDVRSMFVDGSRLAAGKMVSLMNSESEGIQMSAAKDILDRAGHRPADIIEHKHSVSGGLVIEYVKKDSLKDIPVIEGKSEVL